MASFENGDHKHFAPKSEGTRSGGHFKSSDLDGGSKADAAPKAADTVGVSSATDGLRRVKKKKHKALKRVAIVLGVLVGIVVVAAAALALWLGSINSSMQIDEGDREALSKVLSTPSTTNNNAFYALIVGSDARSDDTTSRSDVTMLVRVDPSTATVDLVSIPRDTMVTINGSTQKINAAYAFGGAAGAVSCVSEFAGVPISHYAEVHFDELKKVVDSLGGIWVDIPQDIEAGNGGMAFSAGNQLLNGEQALAYARERYNVSGGDFGRAQAQRQIVEAIVRTILSRSPAEIPGLVSQLASSVSTDMSVTELINLATTFAGKDLTVYSAACPSYTLNVDGVSYVGTMFDEWRRTMQLVDAGLDPNDDTAEIPEEQAQNQELGAATNSAAPRDYQSRAAGAMTTDDVATIPSSDSGTATDAAAQ